MLVFFAFMAILAVIFLVVFSSSIYHFLRVKCLRRKLDKEMDKLPDLYSNYVFRFEEDGGGNHDSLGLGPDTGSDISFSDAHRNQDIAVRSVLKLIKDYHDPEGF